MPEIMPSPQSVICQHCGEVITRNWLRHFFWLDYTRAHTAKTGHNKFTIELPLRRGKKCL